jgi:hypothetical protein
VYIGKEKIRLGKKAGRKEKYIELETCPVGGQGFTLAQTTKLMSIVEVV